jgi:hypothetical protein
MLCEDVSGTYGSEISAEIKEFDENWSVLPYQTTSSPGDYRDWRVMKIHNEKVM